eukprot:4026201-Pleurochrysis_carterae.AAC.2
MPPLSVRGALAARPQLNGIATTLLEADAAGLIISRLLLEQRQNYIFFFTLTSCCYDAAFVSHARAEYVRLFRALFTKSTVVGKNYSAYVPSTVGS